MNWCIVMAPVKLVESVVAHELCHLGCRCHSPAFRRLLARVVRDFEVRRNGL